MSGTGERMWDEFYVCQVLWGYLTEHFEETGKIHYTTHSANPITAIECVNKP